jgi:alpha-galactosidase
LLAAPLLAGNDLTTMTPATAALLTNRELIAIDQDPRGIQGERVWVKGAVEVWVKPLANDSKAVGFFNRADAAPETEVDVPLGELGFAGQVGGYDVWKHKDVGVLPETLRVRIPAHGVMLLRVSQAKGPRAPSH